MGLFYSYIIKTNKFSVKHDFIDNSYHIKDLNSNKIYFFEEDILAYLFSDDFLKLPSDKIDSIIMRIIKLLYFI